MTEYRTLLVHRSTGRRLEGKQFLEHIDAYNQPERCAWFFTMLETVRQALPRGAYANLRITDIYLYQELRLEEGERGYRPIGGVVVDYRLFLTPQGRNRPAVLFEEVAHGLLQPGSQQTYRCHLEIREAYRSTELFRASDEASRQRVERHIRHFGPKCVLRITKPADPCDCLKE